MEDTMIIFDALEGWTFRHAVSATVRVLGWMNARRRRRGKTPVPAPTDMLVLEALIERGLDFTECVARVRGLHLAQVGFCPHGVHLLGMAEESEFMDEDHGWVVNVADEGDVETLTVFTGEAHDSPAIEAQAATLLDWQQHDVPLSVWHGVKFPHSDELALLMMAPDGTTVVLPS